MSKQIIKSEVRPDFVEEVRALITEVEFTYRWALVDGYHQLGTLLLSEFGSDPVTEQVKELSVRLDKAERLLWYAIKFAKKFPKLDSFPEGKNVSWNMVIKKYLTKGKETCKHEDGCFVVYVKKCKFCGKIIK